MKLMVSTNSRAGNQMLNGVYNEFIWASDNMETVAHYYEGCVIELDVRLNRAQHIGYISCKDDIALYGISPAAYTYGMKSGMIHPAGGKWYSFSASYLRANLKGIREIHPNLSKWQEEE